MRFHAAAAGEKFVQGQARLDTETTVTPQTGARKQKATGLDQMGSQFQQLRPLPDGIAYQPEIECFQVPEAAVEQFGGVRARAAAEIGGFEQGSAQSLKGPQPGQGGAVDAAANDDKVVIHPAPVLPAVIFLFSLSNLSFKIRSFPPLRQVHSHMNPSFRIQLLPIALPLAASLCLAQPLRDAPASPAASPKAAASKGQGPVVITVG